MTEKDEAPARLSGAQKGEAYFERFQLYITSHQARDTLPWRANGKLDRGRICEDLGFSRSVLNQNDRVKALLEQVEGEPRERQVADAGNRASGARSPRESALDDRIRTLQDRVAALEEENRYLRQELAKAGFALKHVPEAGSLPW